MHGFPPQTSIRPSFGFITAAAAVSGLVLRHNLHGIDIDARCAQIAALALWMRAQRAFNDHGIPRDNRPAIARTNIVVAEPMPGEEALLAKFAATLRPRALGQLVEVVFEKMQLAGEAGSLLRIEDDIRDAVAEARRQWEQGGDAAQTTLFPATPQFVQTSIRFNVAGVTEDGFWEEAEARVCQALSEYANRASNGSTYQRRVFADDAAQGFAFIDTCCRQYDVVLMNPPFGDSPQLALDYTRERYPERSANIAATFLLRTGVFLKRGGLLGAVLPRPLLIIQSDEPTRRKCMIGDVRVREVADLYASVLLVLYC